MMLRDLSAAFLLALSVCVGPSDAAWEETITAAGSTTVQPIVDDAAEAFHALNPGVHFIVGVGGSSNGVKGVGEGSVDLGMCSRDLKEKEKGKYPDLREFMVGVDGVAVIVNKSNPVEKLTGRQVQDIYMGKISNWKELGGPDAPIDLYGILLSHGTAATFMDHFDLEAVEEGEGRNKALRYRVKDTDEPAPVVASGRDGNKFSCAAVMTNENAISFASIGVAETLANRNAPVKTLALDGVPATSASVAAGDYKPSRPLNVLTLGEPTEKVKPFIDYLFSEEGQTIVEDHGYIRVD